MMEEHLDSFEFIDISKIKTEPQADNDLQEDPLIPRDSDREFIRIKLKEESLGEQIKLEIEELNEDPLARNDADLDFMERVLKKPLPVKFQPLESESKDGLKRNMTKLEDSSSLYASTEKQLRNANEWNVGLQNVKIASDHAECYYKKSTHGSSTLISNDKNVPLFYRTPTIKFNKQFETSFQYDASQRYATLGLKEPNKFQVNSNPVETVISVGPYCRTDSFYTKQNNNSSPAIVEPLNTNLNAVGFNKLYINENNLNFTKQPVLQESDLSAYSHCKQTSNKGNIHSSEKYLRNKCIERETVLRVAPSNKVNYRENNSSHEILLNSSSTKGKVDNIVLDETSSDNEGSNKEIDYDVFPKIPNNEISCYKNKEIDTNVCDIPSSSILNSSNSEGLHLRLFSTITLNIETNSNRVARNDYQALHHKSSSGELNGSNSEGFQLRLLSLGASSTETSIQRSEGNCGVLRNSSSCELNRSNREGLDYRTLSEKSIIESCSLRNESIVSNTLPEIISKELSSCINNTESINLLDKPLGDLSKSSRHDATSEGGQPINPKEISAVNEVNNSINPGQKYQELYPCKYCNFSSYEYPALQTHIKQIHEKNKIKRCPLCSEEFREMSSFSCHIRADHPNKSLYSCHYCKYFTFRKASLKCHIIAVHGGEKPFKCFHCSRAFSRKGGLKIHILRVHLYDKPVKCHYCNKIISAPYLKKHISSVHLKVKKYKCLQCHYACCDKKSLTKHVKNIHLEIKDICTCYHCQHSFTTKGGLRNHIQTSHLGKRKWKCTQCNYASVRKRGLKNHILGHHKAKEYSCPHCPSKFKEEYFLDQHILTHNSETPFECQFCDKRYRIKSCLNWHLKNKHWDKKIYNCHKCNFNTGIKVQLKTHCQKYHNPTYRCSYCDFVTRSRDKRRQHFLTHHEEGKILECPLCGFKATRKLTMKTHYKHRHKFLKPLSCDLCFFHCVTKRELNEHISNQHSGIN